jgi:ribosomal protein L37AE/L43A
MANNMPVKNKNGKVIVRCPECDSKCTNPKSTGSGLSWVCETCENKFVTGKVKPTKDIVDSLVDNAFHIFDIFS